MQVCLLALLRLLTSIRQKEMRAEKAPFFLLFLTLLIHVVKFSVDLGK